MQDCKDYLDKNFEFPKKPYTLIIERDLIKKPNLGGWRNTKTGTEYRNGDSQTGPAPKRVPPEKTCSRKVQTSVGEDKEYQCTDNQATQMWRRDCYIPSVSDKYVTAKPYETFEEMAERLDLDGKARVIQRCYRAYRFVKYVRECARVYRQLKEECDKLREEKYREREVRCEAECRALNDPSSPSGLNYLLQSLKNEELSLPDDLPEHCVRRIRALRLLAERQRIFLTTSEKKRASRAARAQKARASFLTRQCEPKRWLDRKDRVIEMLGLRNQAAIECRDLYEKLMVVVDAKEGRMELLMKARASIEKHYCKPANVFRELIDQEVVLTSKNVSQANFSFLRKRIVGAFLNFLRHSHNCTCQSVEDNCRSTTRCDYEFREPLEMKQFFCTSCRRLRPRSEFPVTSRKQQFNKCRGCVRLQENAEMPLDQKPFLDLLSHLRESEPGGLADAMSLSDLRHLVLDIWHGHSILSENSRLCDLRMPRYDPDQAWSPWNCLLLTEDEAEAHCCVGGVGRFYSEHLKRKIRSAHRTARMDFRGLVAFEGCVDLEKNDDRQSEVETRPGMIAVTATTTTTTESMVEACNCENRNNGDSP